MTPLVSVVIPHFERSILLRGAIDSVFQSSVGNVEVVVVDDGSSGDEWERIQSYSNERVKITQRRDGLKGPSRCRNLGVESSLGSYIIFLDSDDLMAPWCIEQRLGIAATERNADLWVFPVLLFNKTPGDETTLWGRMGERDDALRFVHGATPWQTSSPLWKKSAFESIGGFNEKVFYGDDADLHLRALASGLTSATFPNTMPDVFVRRSESPRVTNSPTPQVVESRRVRLREVVRFLNSRSEVPDLRRAWEAQYFVEAEYLLFNHANARPHVELVLSEWEREFSPSVLRRRAVRGYFSVALASHNRAYFILRVARRVAMVLLPREFFPSNIDLAQPAADLEVMREVRLRMQHG